MKAELIKKYYNETIGGHYQDSYEYERWHKSAILEMGYEMTRDHVLGVSKNVSFQNYLELGPGPGTWTRFFADMHPHASFTLVDISIEMLNLAKKNLLQKNFNFVESDFAAFDSPTLFDFFFSSRAIEYLPDKRLFIKKVYDLMSPGACGCIITKTPHYWRQRILKRSVPAFHRGQIAPRYFCDLLKKQGFEIIDLAPVVIVTPFMRSIFLCKVLHCVLKILPFTLVTEFFSESYAVHFKKA